MFRPVVLSLSVLCLFYLSNLHSENVELTHVIASLKASHFENHLVVSAPSTYSQQASIFFQFPKAYHDLAFDLLQADLSKNKEEVALIKQTAQKLIFVGEISCGHQSFAQIPEQNQTFKIIPIRIEYTVSSSVEDNQVKLIKTWFLISQVEGLPEVRQKYPSHYYSQHWPANNEFKFEIAQQTKATQGW